MTTSYLRRATKADLPAILTIINEAKAYLKEQGINQWQAGYPTNQDIEKDIEQQISYVLMVMDRLLVRPHCGQITMLTTTISRKVVGGATLMTNTCQFTGLRFHRSSAVNVYLRR